jgi:hypothetical protein
MLWLERLQASGVYTYGGASAQLDEQGILLELELVGRQTEFS